MQEPHSSGGTSVSASAVVVVDAEGTGCAARSGARSLPGCASGAVPAAGHGSRKHGYCTKGPRSAGTGVSSACASSMALPPVLLLLAAPAATAARTRASGAARASRTGSPDGAGRTTTVMGTRSCAPAPGARLSTRAYATSTSCVADRVVLGQHGGTRSHTRHESRAVLGICAVELCEVLLLLHFLLLLLW